jgi:hypothetical protein
LLVVGWGGNGDPVSPPPATATTSSTVGSDTFGLIPSIG